MAIALAMERSSSLRLYSGTIPWGRGRDRGRSACFRAQLSAAQQLHRRHPGDPAADPRQRSDRRAESRVCAELRRRSDPPASGLPADADSLPHIHRSSDPSRFEVPTLRHIRTCISISY